ncbi:MAG: pYEATS domain-containing protein [Halieaceae bacterium]
MMKIEMPLTVKQNVIRSVDGRIKYKKFSDAGREHYHLGVWLDGEERVLDEINFVEYELHPSFSNRVRTSKNRKNSFSVTFWTWGMFDIEVRVHYFSGEVETFTHTLEYSLPADDGHTYVAV